MEIWSQRRMVSPKTVFPHPPHRRLIFTVWQKSKPLPPAPSSAACSQMPLQSMPCKRQLLGKLGDRPWSAEAGWLEAPGNEAQRAGSFQDISAAWGTNATWCWFKSRASSENRVTHLHLREDENTPPSVKIQRARVYPPLKQLQQRHLTQPNPRI